MVKKILFTLVIIIGGSALAESPIYNQEQNTPSFFKLYYDKIKTEKLYIKNKLGFYEYLPVNVLMFYYPLSNRLSLSHNTLFFFIPLGEIGASIVFRNISAGWYNFNSSLAGFTKFCYNYNYDANSVGLEFGFAYQYKIFMQPSYISTGYSFNYQLQNENKRKEQFYIHELRYEFSMMLFNHLHFIYKGNFIPNYSPGMNYCDLMQNTISIEIRFRKHSRKSNYWAIGIFCGHRLFKHEKDVYYVNGGPRIFNREKDLYYTIIKGVYFVF